MGREEKSEATVATETDEVRAEPSSAAMPPPYRAEPEQRGQALLPIAALTYYRTDQLTKRPQPVSLGKLETTETQGIVASGKLVLKLWIDGTGRVADVQIQKSDLPEVLTNAAIAGFKDSRFLPGEIAGAPVGSIMHVEVAYQDSRM